MSVSSECSFECIDVELNGSCSEESDCSEILMPDEAGGSLVSLKNKLQKLLKVLQDDFAFSEDGNITQKGEDIRQESNPDRYTKVTEKFIECLGNIFETLQKVSDESVDSIKGEKIDAICFLGKTGSGKSTLVQILGADNTKIHSREVGTNQFIISDDSNIGTNTIISETLYPQLVFDNESSFVLCDNPGFDDSRSSLHEIITMVAVRKFFQSINKIKLVLVCPLASLSKGGDRTDFLNALKQLSQLINDIDKFKNSIYLNCSKVENTGVIKDNEFKLIPDDSVINNVSSFLSEVKTSLNNDSNMNILGENEFYSCAGKIIDCLLQKSDGIYDRISLLRKPMQEGLISNNEMIQLGRYRSRRMLFTDNDFVEIGEQDFHMVLTDSALLLLNHIYKIMDSYITHLSTIISENMKKHYETIIKNVIDDNEVKEILRKAVRNVSLLCDHVVECKSPKEYSDLIKKFSEDNKFSLDFLPDFKRLSLLNEYLSDLLSQSNMFKFSSLSWSASIRRVFEYLRTKLELDNLLKRIFSKLSSYKVQNNRNIIMSQNSEIFTEGSKICGNDVAKFLNIIELPDINEHLLTDNLFLNQLKPIIHHTLNHKPDLHWINQDIVMISDYFVLLSELVDEFIRNLRDVNKIIIFAMHTIFIDHDLIDDHLKGKQLIIIAPIWEVNGSRTINLDGPRGETILRKANTGQIGKDGNMGNPGGKFLGIGMEFKDCQNLKITASGGNGQDGQHGGDGLNGINGMKPSLVNNAGSLVSGRRIITLLFNHVEETNKFDGTHGEPGTDSGEGGKGGRGGEKGTVTVYDVGGKGHQISITTNDGIPGRNGGDGTPGEGGKRGNTVVQERSRQLILILPIRSVTETTECESHDKAANGVIKRRTSQLIDRSAASADIDFQHENDQALQDVEEALENLDKFKNIFVDKYNSTVLRDCITNKFINDALKFVYRLANNI